MSSREMYNLIIKLEKEGMSAEKIIEIIKFIEENKLTESQLNDKQCPVSERQSRIILPFYSVHYSCTSQKSVIELK